MKQIGFLMKKLILAISLFLPMISNAQPKWELINVYIEDASKEQIGKLYLDVNSIDKYTKDDIRSLRFKTVSPTTKDNVFQITIMCSRGLHWTDHYTFNINNKEQPVTVKKQWGNIFDRNTIVSGIKTTAYLAYQETCKDRLWSDINNVEIDTSNAGLKEIDTSNAGLK